KGKNLTAQQCLNVPGAAHDVYDRHVLGFDTIDDEVLAYCEASQAGTQILIAAASDVLVAGKKKKTRSDQINQPVCYLNAPTLLCDVVPDVVKIGFGFRGKAMRHQRRDCSEARRARPCCVTSAGRSRMGWSVISRALPAGREASAAPRAVRISA